jgi:hypothetical protein
LGGAGDEKGASPVDSKVIMNNIDNLSSAFRGLDPWVANVPQGNRVNFLGVLTSLDYFSDPGAHFDDVERARADSYQTSTRLPELTDGEGYFEWIDLLDSIRAARERFVMVELGGGYGSRSVDAHAALSRLNPLPEMYVVVEAMAQHIAWARDNFLANGLALEQHWFVNALVNASGRPELFAHASGVYYSSAIDAATRQRVFDAINSEGHVEAVARNLIMEGHMGLALPVAGDTDASMEVEFVSAIRLGTILTPLPAVDLLDVDIQFAEESVVPDAIDDIERKVKRIHIGTHAPPIHEKLHHLLRERGWQIVFSYMPYATFETPQGRFETKDGILGAINPAL